MTTHLYRLDVNWPSAWNAGLPREVLKAVKDFRDPYRTVFTERGAAYRMREFWRAMGAPAEVRKSNPVTWPEPAESSTEKEVAAR